MRGLLRIYSLRSHVRISAHLLIVAAVPALIVEVTTLLGRTIEITAWLLVMLSLIVKTALLILILGNKQIKIS